jgi:acetyl esterase/lipase
MLFEIAVAVLGLAGGLAPVSDPPTPMTTAQALALPRPAPDRRLEYGLGQLHFGELRLPSGPGPHPVAIVLHGGCWLAAYDLGYVSGLAAALAEAGVATWSVEYRRVGDEGGGWPGTLADVAAAADALRRIAPDHDLDLGRVVALGHSAGGHLALWLGARSGLPADDPLRGVAPLPLRGVVGLAAIPDLEAYAAPSGCGAAVPGLLGGEPAAVRERLERASPAEMLPLGVRQVLVIGTLDPIVPAQQANGYAAAARRAGDEVEIREIEGAGHFELVDPAHPAFAVVRAAVRDLLRDGP